MQRMDILARTDNPLPRSEDGKIPWNDPAFSRRMLREHLDQEHDAASLRTGLAPRAICFPTGHPSA